MEKAIVLLSGGLDSLVTAAVAATQCGELYFLHVSYGQRTQARELQSFTDISRHYQPMQTKVLDWRWLAELGGSRLTDASYQPAKSQKQQDFPDTYVPFRNATLLCAAVAWAEVVQANRIYIGAVEEDSSGYPDCRKIFFEAMQKTIETGSGNNPPISIHTPVIDLHKSEIVALGMKLKAPFELSWSCYFASDEACGKCDSCLLRLNAFSQAGFTDPIKYRRNYI
ncbi:MAG: 7-cyano-7-deazaguanine synthase QueC [Candidatus Cloacimonetes bacterium]|nr:7-cyano-7-deazaguanine synthase QueC [Candidatus Cloacimonadota bacterium]